MNKSSKILLWVVLGAVILLLGITLFTSFYSPATEIKFSEYEEKIANVDASERVTTIVVDDYIYKGYNANGKYIFFAYGDRGDYTAQKLDEWTGKYPGFKYTYTDPNAGSFWSYLIPFFGIILVCVVFYLIIRQTQGGGSKAMSFAKSKARVNSNIKVRFADVAGAEEEKAELAEVVEFLKSPKKFSDLGARIPKGILLVGPPERVKRCLPKPSRAKRTFLSFR